MNKMFLGVLVLMVAGCSEPDFLDTDGVAYQYSDFAGKWQVINYWATWCAPCVKEIPELIALGENHEDILVFGVNYDAPEADEMAKQIEKMKITFPVYEKSPHRRFAMDKPEVLPTTLIVNPDGQVAGVLVGPQTEHSLLSVMGKTD